MGALIHSLVLALIFVAAVPQPPGCRERTASARSLPNMDIQTLMLRCAGANVQLQNESKNTALHWAAMCNQKDVADALLAAGSCTSWISHAHEMALASIVADCAHS